MEQDKKKNFNETAGEITEETQEDVLEEVLEEKSEVVAEEAPKEEVLVESREVIIEGTDDNNKPEDTGSKKKRNLIIGVAVLVVIAIAAGLMYHFGVFGNKPYNYKLSDYITVGSYKGLEYDMPKIEITDEEVSAEIQRRLARNVKTEKVKDGTVAYGDDINIAYEGKIDGKKFDGGSTDSADITVGSSGYISGFDEGLVGKKVGEKFDLNLKFPDDYGQKDLAGKDVVFTVTINYKNVSKVPEYDEKFIKDNSKYDNKADYEKSVKKELEEMAEKEVKSQVELTLWNQVVEESKVKKYPEKELKEEQQNIKDYYKEYAKNYGMEWKDFLKNMLNMSESDFDKQTKEMAQRNVKSYMVLYTIAREENVTINKSEYNKYLEDMIKDYGFTDETFKQTYGMSIKEYAEKNNFETSYMMRLVQDKILELGKAKN